MSKVDLLMSFEDIIFDNINVLPLFYDHFTHFIEILIDHPYFLFEFIELVLSFLQYSLFEFDIHPILLLMYLLILFILMTLTLILPLNAMIDIPILAIHGLVLMRERSTHFIDSVREGSTQNLFDTRFESFNLLPSNFLYLFSLILLRYRLRFLDKFSQRRLHNIYLFLHRSFKRLKVLHKLQVILTISFLHQRSIL